MSGEITTFGNLPIGSTFVANGNHCVKVSSRTATLTRYNRTFYFGAREVVAHA